jgi:7-carboxy-7-deazaguanine synthase
MTIRAILDRCTALGCTLVEVTGGEPLAQPECPTLVTCLLESGYSVLVETNGTYPISALPPEAVKVMDIKCPGSGMSGKIDGSNLDAISPRDEIKFVIGDRADYEWAREMATRHDLAKRCNAVLLSPVFGKLEPRTLADWILEDRLEVRLHVQLHKYIWPPDERGV